MCKKTQFGIVLALLAVGLVGCIPPAPPPLAVSFSPEAVNVASGQVVTVEVITSGGSGPVEYRWEWSGWEGIGYGDGPRFVVTPPAGFVGPVQYVVKVWATDSCGQAASAEKLITIGSPLVVMPTDQLMMVDGVAFWTGGGLNPDGSVNVGPGGVLWFDLSKILKGGVPPYFVYLNGILQPGLVFSWTAPPVTVTTTITLHILVVDSAGNSVERWLVVIVVVNPPQPPPVTPVTVDLKVNGSDGPVTVKARASDNKQSVDLEWNITGATQGTASGAWSGTKNASGTKTVTLGVGTYVFGLSAANASGGSGSDSVTVVVQPADEPPPECSSDSDCSADQHCDSGVCVDDPIPPIEVEVLAPAMDSVVVRDVSTTFTVKITGGKAPYAVNWFFFNGYSPSTSSTATTVSIPVTFDRVTPGIFPVDQYVQVVDWGGRVSAVVVLRVRVVEPPSP